MSVLQRDTARHLEWLKTVKDSHGSVELSSLSLASAINRKGIYIISAQNQKKVGLNNNPSNIQLLVSTIFRIIICYSCSF
jgi:hypothetical protein